MYTLKLTSFYRFCTPRISANQTFLHSPNATNNPGYNFRSYCFDISLDRTLVLNNDNCHAPFEGQITYFFYLFIFTKFTHPIKIFANATPLNHTNVCEIYQNNRELEITAVTKTALTKSPSLTDDAEEPLTRTQPYDLSSEK